MTVSGPSQNVIKWIMEKQRSWEHLAVHVCVGISGWSSALSNSVLEQRCLAKESWWLHTWVSGLHSAGKRSKGLCLYLKHISGWWIPSVQSLVLYFSDCRGLGQPAWLGERQCREGKRSPAQRSVLAQGSWGSRAWLCSSVLGLGLRGCPPCLHACCLLLTGSIASPRRLPRWLQRAFVSLAMWGSLQPEELFFQFTLLEGLASSCPLALPSRVLPVMSGPWNAEGFPPCVWWFLPVALRGAGGRVLDCWPFKMFGSSNCLNFLYVLGFCINDRVQLLQSIKEERLNWKWSILEFRAQR